MKAITWFIKMSFDFLRTISFPVTAYQVFRIVQPAVVKKGRGLRLKSGEKKESFIKEVSFKI